jgi:hypothetical protein
MAKKKGEAAFQDAVVEYARTKGWLVMAIAPGSVRHGINVTNMRYDGAGWPDLTCVRKERMVLIECKNKGIRALRPDQEKWQEAIIGLEVVNPGIEYHILNPIDWDKIERIFA